MVELFADVTALNSAVAHTFGKGRRLSYAKLLAELIKLGVADTIDNATAYGVFNVNPATFARALHAANYKVKFGGKVSNLESTITIDAMKSKADTVILAVVSRNFLPLIEELQSRGTRVVLIGTSSSKSLKADSMLGITSTMLEPIP